MRLSLILIVIACSWDLLVYSVDYNTLSFIEQTGTSAKDEAYGVAVSGDGFIYVTGWTQGSLNSQPYKGIHTVNSLSMQTKY